MAEEAAGTAVLSADFSLGKTESSGLQHREICQISLGS